MADEGANGVDPRHPGARVRIQNGAKSEGRAGEIARERQEQKQERELIKLYFTAVVGSNEVDPRSPGASVLKDLIFVSVSFCVDDFFVLPVVNEITCGIPNKNQTMPRSWHFS